MLRFYVRRSSEDDKTPVDYTVSFEGRILQIGSGADGFDNVYVTDAINANSPYRFTLHVDSPVAISHATVDSNYHQIEILNCSLTRCPDGHEWSDPTFKNCPYDGKPLRAK